MSQWIVKKTKTLDETDRNRLTCRAAPINNTGT